MINSQVEISVVMPCLNEAETLALCIKKAKNCLEKNAIEYEIIVADNGSTDDSVKIANSHSVRVVEVPAKGYGSALLSGIKEATGEYVIMADSDDSYDFLNIMPFIEKLREGFELVMGNRFKGGIKKGAMPFLHRYLGNPVLSFIGRLFFEIPVRDFHCGLRGFKRSSLLSLNLQTTGMEFASEMIVKFSLAGMSITEVGTILSKDGRSHPPHLNTWRDGWRHLRFLMLFSPKWLFLIPGLTFLIIGLFLSVILFFDSINFGGIEFDFNTFVLTSTMVTVGYQILMFYSFIRIYATTQGMLPPSQKLNDMFRYFNLEMGLASGLTGLVVGALFFRGAIIDWQNIDFGPIEGRYISRLVILSVTILTLSVQTIFGSFFLSMLGIQKHS